MLSYTTMTQQEYAAAKKGSYSLIMYDKSGSAVNMFALMSERGLIKDCTSKESGENDLGEPIVDRFCKLDLLALGDMGREHIDQFSGPGMVFTKSLKKMLPNPARDDKPWVFAEKEGDWTLGENGVYSRPLLEHEMQEVERPRAHFDKSDRELSIQATKYTAELPAILSKAFPDYMFRVEESKEQSITPKRADDPKNITTVYMQDGLSYDTKEALQEDRQKAEAFKDPAYQKLIKSLASSDKEEDRDKALDALSFVRF